MGSLQETALLDMGTVDRKLIQWTAKEAWLEVQGVTGWEGHHRTRGRGRDFGGSSSCLDVAFLHSLAKVARSQGMFSLLSRGLLMLTARGNNLVTLQGAAKSARVQHHSATQQLESEIWSLLLGCLRAASCSKPWIAKNQMERCPTLWVSWHSNFIFCR